MSLKRTLLALVTAPAFLTIFSGVGLAADAQYNVDTLRYENRGAYEAHVYVVWPFDNNTNCRLVRNEAVDPRRTADYKIGGTNAEWKISGADIKMDPSCKAGPDAGDEVWMRIEILFGDKETCRKDGTKFYYKSGTGTIKYRSIGTTLNKNRCRIQSLPNEQYLIEPTPPTGPLLPVPTSN